MQQRTMNRIPLNGITLPRVQASLAGAVLKRVVDGSGHGGDDFSPGWINGLSNTRLFLRKPRTHRPEDVLIDHLSLFPAVEWVIEDLREQTGHRLLTQVMVNLLEPGGKLAAHRDGLPDDDRYHLPIVTNPRAVWWDEFGGTIHMDAGFWYGPVPYCDVLHAAANNGHLERLHLVVDFAKHAVE